MQKSMDRMDALVSLCKRRGFIFPSSEIYGGINGFWDYGPLGVELKRNIKQAWWHDVVTTREDVVGLDAAIVMNPRVWEASGHVEGFNDPMVECKACRKRFRADHIYVITVTDDEGKVVHSFSTNAQSESEALGNAHVEQPKKILRRYPEEKFDWRAIDMESAVKVVPAVCPACGSELGEARKFNMMFKTFVGAMEDSSATAFLRPETAQGIFCNYKNVLDTSRMKLPFGIAQIGKAFRNEINPRNFTFRSREFEQMEIEFFCHSKDANQWYEYWRGARFEWYINLGLKSDRLKLRDHEPDELAHYARNCADVEYEFPFGMSELEGVANRTDYDLGKHQKYSGKDMTYFDDETRERFVPYVIEPSAGVDRAALAFLCEAFDEDEAPDEKGKLKRRTVMRFHPRLAPIKAAVFPLVKRDGMPEKAQSLCRELQQNFPVFYDAKGAVGRRYRRQDEAGTPYCITIDGQTLEDDTVTVRERDTMQQERVSLAGVLSWLRDHLHPGAKGV